MKDWYKSFAKWSECGLVDIDQFILLTIIRNQTDSHNILIRKTSVRTQKSVLRKYLIIHRWI